MRRRVCEGLSKIYTGKNFDFEIFVLKYVSNHSESILTKKIFSTKIFGLSHFFTILGFLAEKRLSPRKKFYKGRNFDFEIIGLKYVLQHSESIPTKKFDQNFLTLSFCHYFGHFGRKTTEPKEKSTWPFFTILAKWTLSKKKICNGKEFQFRDFRFKYVSNHSESIPTKKFSTKIFHFSPFLDQKLRFLMFLGQKNFFQKNFFTIVLEILFPKF